MSAADHSHNFKGHRYTPDRPVRIEVHRETPAGDYWTVQVEGVRFYIARDRGRRIRIPYKPRGQNIGWQWWGTIRDEHAKDVWGCRVRKSTGPLAMLHDAGLIRWTFENEPATERTNA